jgi:NADPH:quinone reductase-like Zn-dependent oxidoreductase
MRVAGIYEFGGPVQIIDVPDPRALAADEVLIAVKAAGVGNWDEIVRTGGWDVGTSAPMALGVEASGVVTKVGEEVDGFQPGDEVLCHPLQLRYQGAWAPLLIAPASSLAHKPASVQWETAAAFPVPALTAEQVLTEALELSAGETLLVHGAGGVTGGLLVQLAALRGARVLATSGPSSTARVRQYGALEVFDYNDPSWPEQARQAAADAGITAAANAARDGSVAALSALVDGGRLATITSDPPSAERGIRVSNVYVRPDGIQLQRLAEMLGKDELTLTVASSSRLADAGTTLAAVAAGKVSGAAVVVP